MCNVSAAVLFVTGFSFISDKQDVLVHVPSDPCFPRVQREQLAAIFQLLKDNRETFGEVSEGDMEEQLRLYSI